MVLKEPILKIVNKIHEPLSLIERKFGRYDLAFKTDRQGHAILLFLGKKNTEGKIIGERFARRLVINSTGEIIKDHWERKGKAT